MSRLVLKNQYQKTMKIELNNPYKAIKTLETEELPNFAILIGRNGAGKTQLLQALLEGRAVISCIARDEIEFYVMGSLVRPTPVWQIAPPTNSPAPLLILIC